MLRWFNSDPIFWSFMLGAIVFADIITGFQVVAHWPSENVALAAFSLATLGVGRQFVRAYRDH